MMNDELSKYRNYLRILARSMDVRLRSKLDSSDIVQETLLRVVNHQEAFLKMPDCERKAFLCECLKNQIRDLWRRYVAADKRAIARERSLNDMVDDSSQNLEHWLSADGSAPSEHAVKLEMLRILADAIEALPDDQRDAVELKHISGLSLRETAAHMGKTLPQVTGLLRRAKKQLKETLAEHQ